LYSRSRVRVRTCISCKNLGQPGFYFLTWAHKIYFPESEVSSNKKKKFSVWHLKMRKFQRKSKKRTYREIYSSQNKGKHWTVKSCESNTMLTNIWPIRIHTHNFILFYFILFYIIKYQHTFAILKRNMLSR